MKRFLLFSFLLLCIKTVQAQNVNTHATSYNYFFEDSVSKGTCYFDVTITENTITLDTDNPLVLQVIDRKPAREYEGGELLQMYVTDNEGIKCIAQLYIHPAQKELLIIYQNVRLGYILE